MLIKTQDRNAVIDCSSFEIERSILGGWYINNIYPKTGRARFMGRYMTKGRCREVTNEIETLMLRGNKVIYEMPLI